MRERENQSVDGGEIAASLGVENPAKGFKEFLVEWQGNLAKLEAGRKGLVDLYEAVS